VPVTFAVHDEAILIRTGPDSRLAMAAAGQVLAFEVDELNANTRTGWSVVVTGVAQIVTDPDKRALLQDAVLPWVPGERDVLIELPFTMLTGRRIDGGTGSAGVMAS
jgi:nitroimidazol reductase NimA-like FMN-containing flavoprotein (pyridoxamine 5'-phosphate oxidase superfamily)